jgi:hypothetical protein
MRVDPVVHGREKRGRHSSGVLEFSVETCGDLEDAVISVWEDTPAVVGSGLGLELLERLDVEVGRLIHVEAAEEPEDWDMKPV